MTMKERLREFIDSLNVAELKTLRAMIGGKLSKRTLSQEAQAKMQDGKVKARRKTET